MKVVRRQSLQKESPKERTETSEATTETSREEATQETEKQEKGKEAETEAAQVGVEQEETETSEVIQPDSVLLPASGIGVQAGIWLRYMNKLHRWGSQLVDG